MILSPKLTVSSSQISARYRASPEPQAVDMEITTSTSRPLEMMGVFFKIWIKAMNQGGGGSDMFSPLDGKAKLLSEPAADFAGTSFAWRFSLQSIAPIALRDVMARLSLQPRGGGFIEHFRLVGSLPLDDSPLSVSERDFLRWFDDTSAYPKLWGGAAPFEIVGQEIENAARIRVTLTGGTTPELQSAWNDQLGVWTMLISLYPDRFLKAWGQSATPNRARNKSQLTATYPLFTFDIDPPRNTLITMMIWFHHNVSAIKKLEIALP
jgi:hypothetical protein